MPDAAEIIRDDIFASVSAWFGLDIERYTVIDQGYLNLKWRFESDNKNYFVKQYNKTRYPEQLVQGLQVSLNYQNELRSQGIPAPELFPKEGRYVLTTPSGERFVLMSLCDGTLLPPGTASVEQMHSLGQVSGRMHSLLNRANRNSQPLHWKLRTKDQMYESWHKRRQQALSHRCDELLQVLDIQKDILDRTDPELFADCEEGWAHWDLFADNILFHPDAVAAILDFDRLHYVYPEFDISRALLSCALENDTLHLDRVSAFLQGYREYCECSSARLVRSFKLTWWKESGWITVDGERDAPPIKRFREESIWVGAHWDALPELLGGL